MASSLFVVPSSRSRWRALAAAALAGGLAAAVLVPLRESPPPEAVRTAAVTPPRATPDAPAAPAAAPAADDCRPALATWSATRQAAPQDVDGRFRADRDHAIDACLAPRR